MPALCLLNKETFDFADGCISLILQVFRNSQNLFRVIPLDNQNITNLLRYIFFFNYEVHMISLLTFS